MWHSAWRKIGPLAVVLVTVLSGCQSLTSSRFDELPPTASAPGTSERGVVYARYFDGIEGLLLDDLRSSPSYPDEPSEVVALSQLERAEKRGDSYGTLVRGYIVPPVSGAYEFFVAGDDETAFFLSADATPEQLTRVAYTPRWTNRQSYTQFASQRSGSITLEADRKYYFELSHKQAGGGDHFSVAWSMPGSARQTIAGDYLMSYAPSIYPDSEEIRQAYNLGYRVGFFDGQKNLAFESRYPPLDQDQDGLYDNWEVYYGLDPMNPRDADADLDGDLLTARDEFSLGTNPITADTSGDGLTDGEKFAYGLNPLDPDDLYVDIEGVGRVNLYDYLRGDEPAPDLAYERGFVGQYFSGREFNELVLVRREPAISFNWGQGAPVQQMPADRLSIRWFAYLRPPHQEGEVEYRVNVRSDDGARVYLDGNRIIDAWRIQAPTTNSVVVTLSAERDSYPIMIEYFEEGYGAMVDFWLSDPVSGERIDTSEAFWSPALDLNEGIPGVDSDSDGIPDVWELSFGLNPWSEDASIIFNSAGYTNLQAYQLGLHPWTLQEVSRPDDALAPPPVVPFEPRGTVTLSWTPPGTRMDGTSLSLSEIDSYRISYGTSENNLSQSATVPAGTSSFTLEGLASGTWYFRVQVVDTSGLTSPGSELVSTEVR